jgi:hypothetical protein
MSPAAMSRHTAATAKSLSLAARKASVAKIAKGAPSKARAGIALIDFRELTPREKAMAEKLGRARRGARAA